MKNSINKILLFLIMVVNSLVFSASKNLSENITKPLETIKNSVGTVSISEEYSAKDRDFREKFIILHYTAINREKSLAALTKGGVSSHFLVSDREEDPIYRLVPEDRRAWHAGQSSWKTRTNINDSSIGIEIVNLGNVSGAFEPFTDFQMENVAVLLKYLSEKYEIPPQNILGHSDIAPQRKSDPGPLFKWQELYEKYNIGMWYDEDKKQEYMEAYGENFGIITIKEIQEEFKKFGYGIEVTGKLDKQTENVIKAFQYHFRPENYDGIMDIESFAILKALNDKYK